MIGYSEISMKVIIFLSHNITNQLPIAISPSSHEKNYYSSSNRRVNVHNGLLSRWPIGIASTSLNGSGGPTIMTGVAAVNSGFVAGIIRAVKFIGKLHPTTISVSVTH